MKFQVTFDVTMSRLRVTAMGSCAEADLESALGAGDPPSRASTPVRVWLGRCRAAHEKQQDWRLEVQRALRDAINAHLSRLGDVAAASVPAAEVDALEKELLPVFLSAMDGLGVVAKEIERTPALPG